MDLSILSRILFLALLILGTQSPLAEESDCLDQKKILQLTKEIRFESKNGLKFDYCSSKNLMHEIAKALLFIKELPPLRSSHDVFDHGLLDEGPYHFFRKRVNRIVFEPANVTGCQQGYMGFTPKGEGAIHVCPHFQANGGPIEVQEFLMHESRHVEGFEHTPCRHGALAALERTSRQPSCDPKYDYNGAFTVEAEYAVKLARTESLSPAIRQAARGLAIENFKATFNEYPFGMRPGAILQSETGSLSFYDGQTIQDLPRPSDRATVFTKYYTQLFLIYPVKALVETFMFAHEPSITGKLGPWVTNEITPERRNSLLDVSLHSAADFTCYLFSDAVNCYENSNPTQQWRLKLSLIQPLHFLDAENSRLLPLNGIYIVDKDSQLHALPTKFTDLRKIDSEQKIPKAANPTGLLSVGKWKSDQEIVLSKDGKVLIYIPKNRKFTAAPGLANKKFVKLVGPFLWSSRLEEI